MSIDITTHDLAHPVDDVYFLTSSSGAHPARSITPPHAHYLSSRSHFRLTAKPRVSISGCRRSTVGIEHGAGELRRGGPGHGSI